ncbi:MAG: hypothetical protein JNL60_18585 [Bacteroidia bacterium]|nr:hypothetical protein [Bacteroidia bacterium]
MTNKRHSGGNRTMGRDSSGRFTSGNRNDSNSNRNRRNDGYYNLRYHEDEDRNYDYNRQTRDNYDYNYYDNNYDERYDNRNNRHYDDYDDQRSGGPYLTDWDDRRRGYRGGWASHDEPTYERDRNDTYDRDEDRSRYYGSEGRRSFDDHREYGDRYTDNHDRENNQDYANRGRGSVFFEDDELSEASGKGTRMSHRGSNPISRGGGSGKTKTSYSQRAANQKRSNRSRNK